LAAKPGPVRADLERNPAVFDALTPAERRFRLRALEVRWELLSLMKRPPGQRAPLLQGLPKDDRPFAEFRLRQWDALPLGTQRAILENEITVRYFLRLQSNAPADRRRAMANLPPDLRRRLEVNLARWRELPRDRRERMLDRFNQFFALTRAERERILSLLPEPQRRQTQNLLQNIEQLPASRRQQVIKSLRKFADMTPAERARFLQNATRWEAMSPQARQAWLSMMRGLPPLPPGIHPTPPLPPGLQPPLPPHSPARLTAGGTN
jgi:Protein of unknown function (DUF3106)